MYASAHSRHLRLLASCATLSLCLFSPLPGQNQEPATTPAVPAPAEPIVSSDHQSLVALDSVRDSIRSADERIAALASEGSTATAAEKERIEAEIKQLVSRREVLRSDFESIATGIDPAEYDQAATIEFNLAGEVQSLVRPIVDELKEFTKKPREIEQYRSELSIWRKRLATTDAAIANLELLPPAANPDLATAIAETRQKWEERRQQAENRIQAIGYQLEQATSNQPSLFSSFREGLRSFFRSRGRNLFLCLVAFFGTFFLLRYGHERVNRLTPWVKKGERPFYTRIVDVGLHLFSVIGAVVAAMVVLYSTGDWVLLGLAIIVLLGLALAAKSGLPKFYAHGRILMNLGEVREGERVVYDGIPWKVERLSFFTILKNEQLRGGVLRLPVTRLDGLISRAMSPNGELWFPCSEGDWVDLPDEGRGKVLSQTPEFVQIVKLGGARITIPTAEFLLKSPVNLSHSFRIATRFGIDYKHISQSTTTIPGILWTHLTREISSLIDEREQLISLKVEFAEASSSSLNYAIIADFDGSLAHRYEFLSRALQRLAVDCCLANHWEIPFTQITLHNAYPSTSPPSQERPAPKAKLP
jgi:predicted  nucleic acid-binding Zn-ribbon protein